MKMQIPAPDACSTLHPHTPIVLPHARAGGVTLANMHEWLAIPAVLAIGGTWLATRDAINRGAWKEIADACKAAINRVAEIRGRATRKD